MSEKYIIFGIGAFFRRRKHLIPNNANVVGYADNNEALQGTVLDGIVVVCPEKIKEYDYDKIAIASIYHEEIRTQLLELGVANEKILYWEEFISEVCRGQLKRTSNVVWNEYQKKLLFVVPEGTLSGGFISAVSAAIAIKRLNIAVTVVAQFADDAAIEYCINNGVELCICPSILYPKCEELEWIEKFDYIICNSFQTLLCACRINKSKKVLAWIHENDCQYSNLLNQYSARIDETRLKEIKIVAVSEYAKKILCKYYPDINVEILPLFIPDRNIVHKTREKDKKIFVLIGGINERKNQLEAISELKKLPDEMKKKTELWLVGRKEKASYYDKVKSASEGETFVKFLGEKSPDEICELMQSVDVLLSTSTEETFSIAILEGMMYGKVVVMNSNVGISTYINQGVNGFIYDQYSGGLREVIEIIMRNSNSEMQKIARKTYEDYFIESEYIKNITGIFIK